MRVTEGAGERESEGDLVTEGLTLTLVVGVWE